MAACMFSIQNVFPYIEKDCPVDFGTDVFPRNYQVRFYLYMLTSWLMMKIL